METYYERKDLQLKEIEEARYHRIRIFCTYCKTEHKILVNISDLKKWQNGMLIQRAMPYLSPSEREMLISQTCNVCWQEMFKEENEEDINNE